MATPKATQQDSPTLPYVDKMARYMEEKLAENRSKGDRDGWLPLEYDYLDIRVAEEYSELREALSSGVPPETVWREAADVANFLMMIADKYEHEYGDKHE